MQRARCSSRRTYFRHELDVIKATPSVERVIITSSQFVCGPGYIPKHDEDFAPVTVYGQSKVLTEQLTRQAGLRCVWTIVRPTNIWGRGTCATSGNSGES